MSRKPSEKKSSMAFSPQNFTRHAINAADEKPLAFTLINIMSGLENTLIKKLIFSLTMKAAGFLSVTD